MRLWPDATIETRRLAVAIFVGLKQQAPGGFIDGPPGQTSTTLLDGRWNLIELAEAIQTILAGASTPAIHNGDHADGQESQTGERDGHANGDQREGSHRQLDGTDHPGRGDPEVSTQSPPDDQANDQASQITGAFPSSDLI